MPDPGTSSVEAVAERLSREVPDLLAQHHIPGLAVGICDRSGISWSAGFGVRARGGDDPVSTQTMFSIQSTSKMYAATAVMLAVQQGLVDLDAPVPTYLPDFTVHSQWERAPEQRMTLRHLLNHTAGFTHEAPLGGNLDDRDTSFEEHCQSIRDTWLRFPVGHHYEYSNLGIDLAGYVLQRVSGMEFHEYVRRELLAPLGLARTTFDNVAIAAEPDRAVGHSDLPGEIPVRVPMVAAGGAYTCVDDALRYVQFHLSGGMGVLRTDLLRQMYQLHQPVPGQQGGYGLGVAIGRWNGRRVLNHGGGGFGFLCDLGWDPAAGVGVVVLTNSDDHPLHFDLASGMLRDLTGSDVATPDLPPAARLDGATLRRMVGEYVGRGGTVARIALDGTQLTLERWGTTKVLRTVGDDELVLEDDGTQRFRLLGRDNLAGSDGAHQGPDGPAQLGYLVSLDDGSTYYRNDLRALPADATVQSYAVDVWGAKAATLILRRHGDDATLEGVSGPMTFPPLRLTAHDKGRYFCSMGEALDLAGDRPTYANIALRPEPPS